MPRVRLLAWYGAFCNIYLHIVDFFDTMKLPAYGGQALHTTAGGWLHTPKGGETMRITMHIGSFTVTIIIKKRKNRHSAK